MARAGMDDQYYADASHPDYAAYGASGAAISVAVAMGFAIVIVYAMQKSGFKAMVAVGR